MAVLLGLLAGCGGGKSAHHEGSSPAQAAMVATSPSVTRSQTRTLTSPSTSAKPTTSTNPPTTTKELKVTPPPVPGGSVVIVGCRLDQRGAVSPSCFYTAGPRSGFIPRPIPGTRDATQGCTWRDLGQNAAGGLELYRCR